jgi:hypothetical protein
MGRRMRRRGKWGRRVGERKRKRPRHLEKKVEKISVRDGEGGDERGRARSSELGRAPALLGRGRR